MSSALLARPAWRGRTNVDALTIAALTSAERFTAYDEPFHITQGSYNTSVDASAGTHAGGGALDLRWRWRDDDLRALRWAGFAAWHRTPDQGPWPHHIHAVLVDHPALSPAAARQVVAYRAGRNGLTNNGPDDGPRFDTGPEPVPVPTWEDYMIILSTDADLDALAARTAKSVWRYEIPGEHQGGPAQRLLRRASRSLEVSLKSRELIKQTANITDEQLDAVLAALQAEGDR